MKRGLITIILAVMIVFPSMLLISRTAKNFNKESQDEIQRTIQLIEYRTVTKSNVEFIITNLGMTAHWDSSGNGLPGCNWPRGSQNSYIFGQGICFAAKKTYNGKTYDLYHLSYNPNNGKDWMVSGRIEDGTNMLFSKREKYQVYFSDEFDKTTGEPIDPNQNISWPVWKKDNSDLGKLGIYVFDEQERDAATYLLGPAMVSEQDVHCVFKDTQLSYYFGHNQQDLMDSGYPLNIQYEQTAYLYDNEEYKDMVILRYKIINKSPDTLRDCWIGNISDNDLKVLGPDSGQVNDNARFYYEDQTLNLGITWSDANKGEKGKGFGYIGNSLLEAPAVDQYGNLRKDKQFYLPAEQLSLKTFKLFTIFEDTSLMNNLYNTLSSEQRSINIGPDDIRVLLATGPFNLKPNDTAICAFMINFGTTVSGNEADGSNEDVQHLITSVRNGRDLYYTRHLSTGVEEGRENAHNFSINNLYPNPAENKLNVEFNIPIDGNVRIDLLNVIGNTINSQFSNYRSGSNNITINSGDLPSGSYILKLNYSGTSLTKLISIIK